jgi:aminopeptidase N
MRILFLIVFFIGATTSNAQVAGKGSSDSWQSLYRETPEKVTDLVHTKLAVRPDFSKSYVYGKAWITLKPHFYPSDSVILDAKGMIIKDVKLVQAGEFLKLNYTYADSLKLRIKLDRRYTNNEKFTVYIDYVSRPDELNVKGSAAITDAKGVYFINPLGTDKNKPTELWTQGETEASSVWFPTIDKPNQKTTQELAMTVPAKFVTLSNGKLVSKKLNTDGTRTDTWKMDHPHSPYLFFMATGNFAIVKDSYKGKEVSYYVEKPYEKVARKIFGLTPEMMQFFSRKLGFEYPWVKYAQMTGRDYVSGAMENTTATLHSDFLQQNARQLTDGNKYEDYVSHELFHQWFGDLVTAENWTNLTLNESFANYGETLWFEYKYGKDMGDMQNYNHMNLYLNSRSENKHLVRFYYNNQEDMFDRVSYEKGGRILHMLRNYVGDDAFFKSLNLYLNKHQFKNAEVHDLRLAFEQVTGKDLNWFFNQWYYGSGHPKLDIQYGYNDSLKTATVTVTQTQADKIFTFPVSIDVYEGASKKRYQVWIRNQSDSFSFPVNTRPGLINFDGDKVLLAEKKENKTIYNYLVQYEQAKTYVDRREAIDYAVKHKDQQEAKNLVLTALNDPFYELRERALRNLKADDLDAASIKTIERIARQDEKRLNRAAAIDVLATLSNNAYEAFFTQGTTDSSYSVAGASLLALSGINSDKAIALLPKLRVDAKGRLTAAIQNVEILAKGDADFDEMTKKFDEATGLAKFTQYRLYLQYLANVNDTAKLKAGIDKVVAFRNSAAAFNPRIKNSVNEQLGVLKNKKLAKKSGNNAAAIDEIVRYINEQLK